MASRQRENRDRETRRRWIQAVDATVERYGESGTVEKSTVDIRTLKDWRSGKRLPPAPVLAEACENFGVSLAFVLFGRGGVFGPTDDLLPTMATDALLLALHNRLGDLRWRRNSAPDVVWRWIEDLVVAEVQSRADEYEVQMVFAGVPGYGNSDHATIRDLRNPKREAVVVQLLDALRHRADIGGDLPPFSPGLLQADRIPRLRARGSVPAAKKPRARKESP